MYYELIFVLQTGALTLLVLQREMRTRERQLGEARLAAQQAQLAALRLQLNPHFMFNTLNAISTLVGEGHGPQAEEMIARLAGFFRSTLASDDQDLVPLETELETAQDYLDIEAVRFGARLDVHYICEDGLSQALVPSLILQPLLENAIKHAVAPTTSPVRLTVSAARTGERLQLGVDDASPVNAHPASPASCQGVGLRNVASRLEVLYGSDAELRAEATERGFRCRMSLPFRHPGLKARP